MNEPENGRRPDAQRSPLEPVKSAMSTVLKVAVVVLAVIGAIALVIAVGMGWMHFSMMDGMGMGMGRR
ncbi:MAG: hypothetical protein ABI135_04410 [Rhodoferax sp.]